jgi:magnesium chelatase subunit H
MACSWEIFGVSHHLVYCTTYNVSAVNRLFLIIFSSLLAFAAVTVQPLLGVEGDPMRLLFERDLTPHPQYVAAYEWMRLPEEKGGFGTDACIHLGMHGTSEWLPGQPLGNDRQSWPDELLGGIPNVYVYAANNPSESILAKRRGYGTLVSYNVPPYGRAGLYLELANLKDLVNEYRSGEDSRSDLRDAIWGSCERASITADVPYQFPVENSEGELDLSSVKVEDFDVWVAALSSYLITLEDRLFSSGLHTLGGQPTDKELLSYLNAYFEDKLPMDELENVIALSHEKQKSKEASNSFLSWLQAFADNFMGDNSEVGTQTSHEDPLKAEALKIVELLKRNTEEMDGVVTALNGGYVKPCPGGDLLRDGTSVLPTGRNIHALDPYRMPSQGAWARGQRAAEEILRQHQESNNGAFPETIAVTLWGLDTIKTRGEAIAIVLALVGARPVKEGTGRTVAFELIPLEELGRPRIDVLASLSGIFRDSFANVVDLLDDMFERASVAEESPDMNYIKKHCLDLEATGTERPAARLFSNPPGDYGSMVNEVVGNGDWDETESLGEIWRGRNTYAYGRSEGGGGVRSGTARPEVLDKLLSTTERVVQEIDSVEYGLTDIQEYYSNTGALKKAAENRKQVDPTTGAKKKVAVSIIEAFGGSDDNVPVKDVEGRSRYVVRCDFFLLSNSLKFCSSFLQFDCFFLSKHEDVLRMEYRSKFLNPKWRDAMLEQGSGGAYEVSQRMTAMVGWAATAEVDNFVFDQAAERYALDEEVAKRLQKNNPEAFKNVVR